MQNEREQRHQEFKLDFIFCIENRYTICSTTVLEYVLLLIL